MAELAVLCHELVLKVLVLPETQFGHFLLLARGPCRRRGVTHGMHVVDLTLSRTAHLGEAQGGNLLIAGRLGLWQACSRTEVPEFVGVTLVAVDSHVA